MDVPTDMHATVLRAVHRSGDWAFGFSIPLLDITGPGIGVYEDLETGELFIADVDDERRKGLGDAVTTVDRVVHSNRRSGYTWRLGTALKLPTGNENKGLSNGETDLLFFVKGRLRKRHLNLNTQFGYQHRGDTEFTDYDNRLVFSLGVSRRMNQKWAAGLSWRYKQASVDTRADQRSLSALLSHTFSSSWHTTLHLSHGLTDAVADSSMGLQLTFRP